MLVTTEREVCRDLRQDYPADRRAIGGEDAHSVEVLVWSLAADTPKISVLINANVIDEAAPADARWIWRGLPARISPPFPLPTTPRRVCPRPSRTPTCWRK